mmetsp:Transcript_55132/g.95782  ORF Transcript_55132/g.95782 Transcript_55132/m.95782 type:complete len:224 (+) Transcript_55132:8480-9151(+)
MHEDDNQRLKRAPHKLGDLRTHKIHDVAESVGEGFPIDFQSLVPLSLQGIGDIVGPDKIEDADDDLAWPLLHPVHKLLLEVVLIRSEDFVSYRLQHGLFHLHQPNLDSTLRRYWIHVVLHGNWLFLWRDETTDLQIIFKLQALHAFECLLHMSIDAPRLLGLTEDLQQVVVGEEEEARESKPLCLEIVVQSFLHQLQLFMCYRELVKKARHLEKFKGGVIFLA